MLPAHRPLVCSAGRSEHSSRTWPPSATAIPKAWTEARVATRRIRELLPLMSLRRDTETADALVKEFRSVGRSLGAVRDADVQAALLRSLEAHIPTAAPTLVLLRQQLERRRLDLMREIIKELERIRVSIGCFKQSSRA